MQNVFQNALFGMSFLVTHSLSCFSSIVVMAWLWCNELGYFNLFS